MFWRSALSAADPSMRALAWEMKSRVARAENDFERRPRMHRSCPRNPRQVRHPCGGVASPSHCLGFVRTTGDRERADEHRARAKELIMRIANSFDHDEPLRESLLTAPPIRHVLGRRVGGPSHGHRFG